MLRLSLVLLICFSIQKSFAQYSNIENSLIQNVEQAKDDHAKINALGELAEFYYIYRSETKGDSVLQQQLLLAELSNDKKLVLTALFGSAIDNMSYWTSSETFDKALAFLEKGLRYAEEIKKEDFQALAYIRKAAVLRKRGQYDNAINQATQAFSILDRLKQDSLKAVLYAELGDIFLAKGQAVSAYKNFNKAFDISYGIKNIPLQSKIYHHLSALYQTLGNTDMAKKSLLQSLDLNLLHENKYGLLVDYIDLARLTDKVEYINKALELAQSLGSRRYILYGKRLMFAYLMVVKKNSRETLEYFHKNDDLAQSYKNTGVANYYWNIGNVYRFSNQIDSAIYYYSLAEPELNQSFDPAIMRTVLKGLGECYMLIGNTEKAKLYYEKALNISMGLNDFTNNALISLELSKLYARSGEFENAYNYNKQHLLYNDSLQKQAAQREVVLLEVERENRQHEKDFAEAEAKIRRTRNLQYTGISIAIVVVFLGMILLGMFPISRFTVRLLSFFAFICLFEFIVILIDAYLHRITHGEPLKIWLIKIFLIALLVPVQHFLEHGLVKFLESKRLLKLRQQFSLKKIWANLKKPAPVSKEADFENDTAVL